MKFLFLNSNIIETVIFDFDGTLAKLNIDFPYMHRVIDQLISDHKMSTQPLHSGHVLERISETAAILQNQKPEKAKAFRDEAFRRIETIEIEAARQGELFDQTKSLLTELRQRSIRIGIVTRNCARAVQTVFPDIGSFCPVVVSRDDVREVKPHPEHITTALHLLGSLPRTSLMVGDHPLDIETGRNAETFTAGVLSGHFAADDFIKAGADIVLKRAADILSELAPAGDLTVSGGHQPPNSMQDV